MDDQIPGIDTPGDEGMELGADIMTLMDEDGAEHSFEVLDSAEFEGSSYMALVPVPDEPEDVLDDTGDLVILRIGEEDGEEFLEAIEDEAEFDKVGAFFIERLSDSFDFED
ncbi:MAG: DUF1292 domain-containing protein [Oscillospiraceae bacterium]|nr:DUF1292 domain-containing protein [Oscillospiraceae bacterium]